MSSKHVTVDEPVIKQEKKSQSQSQPISQENNNTEVKDCFFFHVIYANFQVEKVLSQKLSQLSSQETNVGSDEEYDPELPGYSDDDDENDETEGQPCYLCERKFKIWNIW